MNRNDWVFVGTRLYGLYLIVNGLLPIPVLIAATWDTPIGPRMGTLFSLATSLAMGIGLFLGAPYLQCWLEEKDRTAMAAPPEN